MVRFPVGGDQRTAALEDLALTPMNGTPALSTQNLAG